MSVQKARQHAGNGNWPMAAVEALPERLFARVYTAQTGHELRKKSEVWVLTTTERRWYLPRARDALRITHIGDDPRTRVVEKYLGRSPWQRESIQTVIDVGSYLGEFLVRGGFEGLAVEPDSRNYECTLRNIPEACDAVNVLPWYEVSKLPFAEAVDGSESTVGNPDGSDVRESPLILAKPLTRILDSHGTDRSAVDLVKVDAEGAEVEVLAGAVGLETRFAVDVSAERDGLSTAGPCEALLRSHGYDTALAGDILYAEPRGESR